MSDTLEKSVKQKKQKKVYYRTENKYDPYLIKDVIQNYITHIMTKQYQVKESFKFQNFKCLLGLFIVVNVIISHYHGIPWPDDKYILLTCVVIYESNTEEDIFLLYTTEMEPQKQIAFGMKMDLYQNQAEIRLMSLPNKNILSHKKIDVSNYFDEDGYIHKKSMKKLIKDMIEEYQKKSKQQ